MKFLFTMVVFLVTSISLRAQSLDYARDVFFYESPLENFKNYYYQNSPLLSVMHSYGGKGLNVVVVCPEATPISTAKLNIQLDLNIEFNRPYLSNLNFINTPESLRDFLKKHAVDIIIIEESFVLELSDIRKSYPNQVMVFSGSAKIIKNADLVEKVRPWWHYSFKMDSISKELIKVWHNQETYCSFILFIERTKNFTISIHKRLPVIFFLILLGLIIVCGYYRRLPKVIHKRLFLGFLTFVILVIGIGGYCKFLIYQGFVGQVNYFRYAPKDRVEKIFELTENPDVLKKVIALRSLTERIIAQKDVDYYKNNLPIISEKLKILMAHEDERVRMWCLELISNLKDESLINYVASLNWQQENSYLVRTRVVRVLGAMQNENTDSALRQIVKFESHPYAFTELRDVCIERGFWWQGVAP